MDDQRVFEATEEGGQLTLKDRQAHGKAEIVNSVPTARLQTVCQLDAVASRRESSRVKSDSRARKSS